MRRYAVFLLVLFLGPATCPGGEVAENQEKTSPKVASEVEKGDEAKPKAPGRERISVLVERLGDENWEVREKAASILLRLGEHYPREVLAALPVLADDPEVRTRVSHLRLVIPLERRRHKALEIAGKDTSFRSAIESAFSFRSQATFTRLIQDAGTHKKEAVRIVTWFLEDLNSKVRLAALSALAGGNAHSYIGIGAHGHLKHVEDASQFRRCLSDPDPEVRTAACLLMAACNDRSALPILARLLSNDHHEKVRSLAAFAIGQISGQSWARSPELPPDVVGKARAWWEKHKDDAEFKPKESVAKKPER